MEYSRDSLIHFSQYVGKDTTILGWPPHARLVSFQPESTIVATAKAGAVHSTPSPFPLSIHHPFFPQQQPVTTQYGRTDRHALLPLGFRDLGPREKFGPLNSSCLSHARLPVCLLSVCCFGHNLRPKRAGAPSGTLSLLTFTSLCFGVRRVLVVHRRHWPPRSRAATGCVDFEGGQGSTVISAGRQIA